MENTPLNEEKTVACKFCKRIIKISDNQCKDCGQVINPESSWKYYLGLFGISIILILFLKLFGI